MSGETRDDPPLRIVENRPDSAPANQTGDLTCANDRRRSELALTPKS